MPRSRAAALVNHDGFQVIHQVGTAVLHAGQLEVGSPCCISMLGRAAPTAKAQPAPSPSRSLSGKRSHPHEAHDTFPARAFLLPFPSPGDGQAGPQGSLPTCPFPAPKTPGRAPPPRQPAHLPHHGRHVERQREGKLVADLDSVHLLQFGALGQSRGGEHTSPRLPDEGSER